MVPDFRLNKAFEQMGYTDAGYRKKKWNFCAMNAAGLAARTGSTVMKPSAAKILEKAARSITVQHRSRGAAIVFQRR